MTYKEFIEFQSSINWKVGQSLQQWANNFLDKLASQTKSLQGAIYCSNSSFTFLHLIATYSVVSPHLMGQKIAFGEGIVGLVAKDKKTKLLTENIPGQFTNSFIHGKIIPSNVILVPIVFNEMVYGVFEFSALHNYNIDDISFFETIAQTQGIQLVLLVKEGEQKALSQSLETQNEEIHQKNDKLQELYEEINTRNEEITSQNDKLKETRDELLKNKEELKEKNEKIEISYRNLQIIGECGKKITASIDFKTISYIIYNHLSQLVDTAAFGIGLYHSKKMTIKFSEFIDNGKTLPEIVNPLNQNDSLAVWCLKNQQEILIQDYDTEIKKYLKKGLLYRTGRKPISLIYEPLSVEGTKIGVLTVQSYKKAAYSVNNLNTIRTLASYISIALDNANAYRIINRQIENIQGGLRYALTIQKAILPDKAVIDKDFESFIMYFPKDVVSGDFYWFASVKNIEGLDSDNKVNLQGLNNCNFLAVVDCTGHGVPGAFMSLIGNRLLNEIVTEQKNYNTAVILDKLHQGIVRALKQEKTFNNDGMDVCLIAIENISSLPDKPQVLVRFAGAKLNLYYSQTGKNKIQKLMGDRQSIGGSISIKKKIPFTEKSIQLFHGDMLYLSSDGLFDQQNKSGKKFTAKRFEEHLNENYSKPVNEQYKNIQDELFKHKGEEAQRDDITVIGIKI